MYVLYLLKTSDA